MTSLQLYMCVLRFLPSYTRTQAAGQNGSSGSTLSQQLSQLASFVLAQGKRDRCSSGAAGGRSSRYLVYLPTDTWSWANSFVPRTDFAHWHSWGNPQEPDPRSHLPALSGLKCQFLPLSKDLCSGQKQRFCEGEIFLVLFWSVLLPSEDEPVRCYKGVCGQSHQQEVGQWKMVSEQS